MVDVNVSQHFRPDEQAFVESVADICSRVENEYRPIQTDFLNPREMYIFEAIANRFDSVSYRFFGGYDNAEMKRALVYPEYFEPKTTDFNIAAFLIDYPTKFATLSHGQILGTIMGSGINRNVIGDIITDGDTWQFICESEMSDFLQSQIEKIGKIKVKLKPIDVDQLVFPVDESEETGTTVSSLRLDTVISEGFNLSRHHAKELVEGKAVRLNWETIDRPDVEVSVSDVVSVRHFGRIKIKEISGLTKKGKIRIVINLLRRNK
ncbi:RNA-binding protein [Lentilactobacillus kosonis]|uniref:RNA-binding S4 domain-containing protein n=1 Tax=Lentilactobacillus kosonis TaxID=2810561 RepID=A0A401FNV3_9LACO|nr:YlmH/Sll1252 family protein [Lentilactobacillus kosonis]GAY74075.1 hypothetical protein, contains S4-like RNA binding domain [Lentilactobacillus kosonis]